MKADVDAPGRGVPSTATAVRSFDDLLGAPETRYFATGYQRVRYAARFETVSIGELGRMTLEGVGTVMYPADWSLASNGQPRASHLSSIDALVLGIASVEHVMTEMPGICRADSVVIDSVSIRSGVRPHVQLNEVPVSASVMADERGLVAELRAGGFRIEVRLHETATPLRRAGRFRPYWDGYRHTEVESELLEVDTRDRSIVTRHTARRPTNVDAAGIDSSLWPGLTHIDNVALFGQVAQVLAQTTVGIERGSIDNLWMRRMAFTRVEPVAPKRFQAQARLLEHSAINRGGKVMHSLQMEAVSDHGVKAEALFGFVVTSP